jgi:hypothetical protein
MRRTGAPADRPSASPSGINSATSPRSPTTSACTVTPLCGAPMMHRSPIDARQPLASSTKPTAFTSCPSGEGMADCFAMSL